MTRAAWHTALKLKVLGVSTDAALFSTNGTQLVHYYWVFRQCDAQVSLRGPFMKNLLYFTARASADAKWTARRNRIRGTGSPTPSFLPEPLPRSIRTRPSDDDSPACKASRSSQIGWRTQRSQPSLCRTSIWFQQCQCRVRFPTVGSGQVYLFCCLFLVLPTDEDRTGDSTKSRSAKTRKRQDSAVSIFPLFLVVHCMRDSGRF